MQDSQIRKIAYYERLEECLASGLYGDIKLTVSIGDRHFECYSTESPGSFIRKLERLLN